MNCDLANCNYNNLMERSDKSPFDKGGFRGNVNMKAVK